MGLQYLLKLSDKVETTRKNLWLYYTFYFALNSLLFKPGLKIALSILFLFLKYLYM